MTMWNDEEEISVSFLVFSYQKQMGMDVGNLHIMDKANTPDSLFLNPIVIVVSASWVGYK